MPSVLARRTFPPARTAAQLEPGFRDAPDPAHHLAILFMKVSAKFRDDWRQHPSMQC